MSRMILAAIDRPQLMLLAGLVLLGWVFMRRSIRRRRASIRESRQADRTLASIRHPKSHAVPLSDAPPETQRWQVAMFDLQRELKGELETKIAMIHGLIRHADQRIEELRALQGLEPAGRSTQAATGLVPEIAELSRQGWTAEEIAQRTGTPLGDVELLLVSRSEEAPARSSSEPGPRH